MPGRPEVTLGASFNWYTPSLGNDYVRHLELTGPGIAGTETLDGLRGYNFTFGVLWDAYERDEDLLTLGFICHTPFTAEVKRELIVNNATLEEGTLDIDFPLSLGAGANYRFSDEFSTAFDMQWTQWSEHTTTGPLSGKVDIQVWRN